MHKEILSEDQEKLLPLIKAFSSNFGLVGGTAIALYLGHRRSIDFDLFTNSDFSSEDVKKEIRKHSTIQTVLINTSEELTLALDNVKITFYKYPYSIDFPVNFENIIKVPSLLTLSAMKAFALGRRAKWKDYVDIFFITKEYSFKEIVGEARKLFGSEFNERLFREQISYYKDIDYSESIDYLEGKEIANSKIKQTLREMSLL